LVGFVVSLAGFAVTTSALFIALLGISSIVLVAADAERASLTAGVATERTLSYFAPCVAAVLAALAVASDARWILGGFDGSIPLSGWSWQPAYVSLQLLGVLHPILPQLALLCPQSSILPVLGRLTLSKVRTLPHSPRRGYQAAGCR
jgi:hypothetical protein